ncbi:MAG: hypothetical protein JNM63_14000, partial [Spirochaetia bacterium]|nr:hypothetical protein [Spirochaetia bacterium]
GVESKELYSLAIHVKHVPSPANPMEEVTQVWMLAPRDYTEGNVDYVDSEEKILLAFLEAVKTHNPQVFIGWNVVQFDFDFLIGKYQRFGLPMNFGIGARPLDHFKGKNNRDLYMKIPGRAVLDGIPTLRALGFQMERWSLDHVSRELLGEGKLISPDEDKIAEIEALFKDNKAALADYNLKDTTLVTRIFEKAEVLEVLMERQGLSGTLIEKQNFPSEILDSLYLPALHRLRLAGPTTPTGNLSFGSQEQKPIRKGVPGYFSDVAELSFADFLPNLLESFLIDPLGRALGEWLPDEGYAIPGNALRFHRTQHLLPAIFSELKKHEGADAGAVGKAAHSLRQALRQALDSQYSRFYSPSQNAALRHIATLLIAETNLFLESLGMRILLADLESIFFHKPDGKIGNEFLPALASHLASWSEKTFHLKTSVTPVLIGHYG